MALYYDEPVFRPPSEADSLILQVTIGCSHNKCVFCEMYGSKTFRTRSLDDIEKDIVEAKKIWKKPQKIFLADGDSFVLSPSKLIDLCDLVYKHFPYKPRISAYASPQNILVKTEKDLKKTREAGISLLYYGLESGNDFILKKISKDANSLEMQESLLAAKYAGFDLSVTWILGLGGKKYSNEHVNDTAKLLGIVAPKYTSALTLMLPLGIERIKKEFSDWEEITAVDSLMELKLFIELYNGETTIFRSNHASNYLPIKGNLPEDKKEILELIGMAIDNPDDSIRPEWARGL